MSRFNKTVAAAAVGISAWAASLAGLDIPAEVQAMAVTVLVWAVPNADRPLTDDQVEF